MEFPWSTRTFMISHSSRLIVMTMGSLLGGWMSNSSFSKNVILVSRIFIFSLSHLIGKVFYIMFLEDVDGLPASGETSCDSVERMAHDFVILPCGCLFFSIGLGVSCVISPTGARLAWSLVGVIINILIKVSLLDQPLDLFLELIEVLLYGVL